MAYNRFRWFTKGRPKQRLPNSSPLLLKIRNGDFDYSYMFEESKKEREQERISYEQGWNGYKGTSREGKEEAALTASRMKRVKALKLMEEAHKEEISILDQLREELAKEFEVDLWEDMMKEPPATIEDIYWWYKTQTKESITKSELRINLGWKKGIK